MPRERQLKQNPALPEQDPRLVGHQHDLARKACPVGGVMRVDHAARIGIDPAPETEPFVKGDDLARGLGGKD